jgi:hypothetical protein
VFALFCDGSVHFINDSIDSYVTVGNPFTDTAKGTWQRLAWINDGQIPGNY